MWGLGYGKSIPLIRLVTGIREFHPGIRCGRSKITGGGRGLSFHYHQCAPFP